MRIIRNILLVGIFSITIGHILCVHSNNDVSIYTEQPEDIIDYLKHLLCINLGENHLEYFETDNYSIDIILSLDEISHDYFFITPFIELATNQIFCEINVYFPYSRQSSQNVSSTSTTRGSPSLEYLS